jgi:hypothetical protein
VSGWKGIVALACALALLGAPTSNSIVDARRGARVERGRWPESTLLGELRPAVANVRDGSVTFLSARPGRPFDTRAVAQGATAAARAFLGKFWHRPPGGESWADVALRLRTFLDTLGR